MDEAVAGLGAARVQVVTVTDTTAAITWETAEPQEGGVAYGTDSRNLDQTAVEGAPPRRFHQCRLAGLQPGTKYHFACRGDPESGERSSPHMSFTTLVPPPGRELFAFATMTDTHIGQEVVGRVVLAGGKLVFPGVRWREPQVPLWEVALQPALEEINSSGCAFTVVKGDLTHNSAPGEFRLAREILGGLSRPFHVVRGNHDHPDLLLRTFNKPRLWYSFDHGGMHFVVLDTEPLLGRGNAARESQLQWLAADLGKHADQWTFVFLHRPIQPDLARSDDAVSARLVEAGSSLLEKMASPTAARALKFATGHLQDVPEPQARRMVELFAQHGRVAGVFAGHVHRNFVGYWPEQTGNLPYVETAPPGEYPCGYAITRVFTGGYMHNYHVPDDDRCLEWSATTRETFERMGVAGKAGTLADRNFVVGFENLDLTR
jgi:3',5'-cyclic AMP phosphodiesterase CpdA